MLLFPHISCLLNVPGERQKGTSALQGLAYYKKSQRPRMIVGGGEAQCDKGLIGTNKKEALFSYEF